VGTCVRALILLIFVVKVDALVILEVEHDLALTLPLWLSYYENNMNKLRRVRLKESDLLGYYVLSGYSLSSYSSSFSCFGL